MSVGKKIELKMIKNEKFEVEFILDFFNSRLKIEDFRGNIYFMLKEVEKEIDHNQFEKMIIKSRREQLFSFINTGFMLEAVIKGYFLGNDVFLMTKYFSNKRRNSEFWLKEDKILTSVFEQQHDLSTLKLPQGFQMRKATPSDAEKLAIFYSQIFKVYPTPLNDPVYINQAMKESTCFYIICDQDRIISAASAEINHHYKNAELTDCATLQSYRKHGLMKILLIKLENELINRGIFCAYSIARSLSFGMNLCFHQLGYVYTGRLTNNCNIYDKMEDMNVWVKDLSTLLPNNGHS